MDNGVVTGFDTHENLLKDNPLYQEINAIQSADQGDFDKRINMRQPNFGGPRGPKGQAGFQKASKEQRAVIWRLAKYVLSDYKFSILTVLVCIAITSVTTLASTLFTRTLIDDYIVPLTQVANPEYTSLLQTLFKLGLILFVGVVCSYLYNRLMINVSQGTMLRLRQRIFERMERLPISYFDQHSHGDMMSVYTNDVDSLRQMISTSISQVFNSIITICVTFASMIALSIPLTAVSILMAVVMMAATTWLGKRSRGYFRTQQESLAQSERIHRGDDDRTEGGQGVLSRGTGYRGVRTDQRATASLGLQCQQNRKYRDACQRQPLQPWLRTHRRRRRHLALSDFTHLSPLASHLSLGTIVAFLTLNKSFTQPITHVSQQINSVLNATVGAERVFRLMDAEPEADEGTIDLTDPKGDVDFTDVDFGYIPQKQVLFDIDINTNPGQKIAFVGGTGASKTTIINLINRFYEIQRGKILYDGIPLTDIRKESLRKVHEYRATGDTPFHRLCPRQHTLRTTRSHRRRLH